MPTRPLPPCIAFWALPRASISFPLDRLFICARPRAEERFFHGGEVYQYLGDEMVITWTASEARERARPLACFFAIEQALEQAAPEFERDFGAVPRLRAALHAGPVIAGEVGESRRAAAAWPRHGGARVRGHGQAVRDGRPGTIYVS